MSLQEKLWEQEAIGLERWEMEEETGSAVHERSPQKLSVAAAIAAQVVNAGGQHKLLVLYYEQLQRAQRLIAYMDDNVGMSEDWPLLLMSDSDESEVLLTRRLTQLRNASNFLTELAESAH